MHMKSPGARCIAALALVLLAASRRRGAAGGEPDTRTLERVPTRSGTSCRWRRRRGEHRAHRSARAVRAHASLTREEIAHAQLGPGHADGARHAAGRIRVLRRRQRHRLFVPLAARLPAAAHQRAHQRRAAQRPRVARGVLDRSSRSARLDRARSQVQRGVGSALYGAASVGGSVNLETAPFSDVAVGELLGSVGSFGTTRD